MHQVIHLHPAAPPKPAEGAPCNGCGVCCAAAPCPIGMVFSRKTTGACVALLWEEKSQVYRCGLVANPSAYLPGSLSGLGGTLERIARRSISAGSGCDCSLVPTLDP